MYIDVYALYSSTDHEGTKNLNDISDDGESEEEIWRVLCFLSLFCNHEYHSTEIQMAYFLFSDVQYW